MKMLLFAARHHRRQITPPVRPSCWRSSGPMFAIILCSALILLQKDLLSQDTIKVSESFTGVDIGNKIYLQELTQNKMPVFPAGKWSAPEGKTVTLNANKVTVAYYQLSNQSHTEHKLLMTLNNPHIPNAIVYKYKNGIFDSVGATGSFVNRHARLSASRKLSIPIGLSAGESISYYIIFRTADYRINFTPKLLSAGSVNDKHDWSDYLLVALLSTMLLSLIASLVTTHYLPIAESWWFVASVIFGCLYVSALSGLGSLHLWNGYPKFESQSLDIFQGATTISILEFIRRIIRSPRLYPRFNKLVICCLIGYGFFLISPLLFAEFSATAPYKLVMKFFNVVLIIFSLIAIEICLYNTFSRKEKEFLWLGGVLVSLILIYTVNMLLKSGYMSYGLATDMILSFAFWISLVVMLPAFMSVHVYKFMRRRKADLGELKQKHSNSAESGKRSMEGRIRDRVANRNK